ncbi:hypothetical protein F5878DRAFT_315827 [Lentinula raphanica]|uniref:Uncharacterized protein n=1 Tax=Lentinula raphanica TaxID=153919 RepID=A0AA38P2X7_9AGAR|nr:hypothetical protein F5878DRAFT_315827 [Lentinula raphanica]
MASIFSRPVSPPPRALSPDLGALNPLPLPPARSKRMSERATTTTITRSAPRPLRRPSKGILKPTPPSSPASPHSFTSSSSSSSSTSSTHSLSHRRSLQFAIPYRSPPASPTLASPPPPVPPIPAFVLDSGASRSHHSTPPMTTKTKTTSTDNTPPPPPRPARSPQREVQDQERPRGGGGMTCSQFMSVHGTQPPSSRRRNPAQAINAA